MQSSFAPRLLRTLALFAATAAAATSSSFAAPGETTATASTVAPTVRVVAPVSDTVLTTLKSNVHPLAQARYDRGAVAGSMPTGRMLLLLRRSPEQETALRRYIDDLQNPGSPNYRKWLTPATLGKTYGISDQDLGAVESWLESQGFRIEKVPAARNMIMFSGTAGSIQSAFHTSIHSYLVNGEKHFANATDPQIPAALAPVIAGIAPMNDFHAKPQHVKGPGGVYDPETKRFKRDLTLYPYPSPNQNTPVLFVDPADAATIYNTPNATLNANYSGSASRDGSGVTIGVVGYSNLPLTDVLNYRTAFLNDTDTAHLPTVIVDGTDPGVLSDGTGVEALLDVEVSGGLAPGASINYYVASSTDLQDGLSLAILRALDDNNVSILSASYGNCEYALGAAGNYQFLLFWEQAASQGITVTTSTGDSGSAACDDPNTETVASGGLAVSGIASTPFNVAVGGTDFAELQATASSFANYVNTNQGTPPYYETALGFIPEVPWNDAVNTNGTIAQNTAYMDPNGNTNITGSGGGMSSDAYCAVGNNGDGTCNGLLSGYPKPAFQQSITPNDGVRDIPDVSFFAANGAYNAIWAICADSVVNGDISTYTDCQTSGGLFTNSTQIEGVGGTSASTPAFAGMLALVSQAQGGARLGLANNVIYNLAANHYGTIFHDVTIGNNSVPCTQPTQSVPDVGCASNGFLSGYDTATGYDLASGLGSMDISALAAGWATASFTPTATTLGVGTTSGTYSAAPISVQHGTPLYFNVAVSPTSATGDVSVTNTSGLANNQASLFDSANTLTNGVVSYSSQDLPGGTYTISAYYEGDATHAASTSAPPINVTISAESSTTALYINVQDPANPGTAVTSTTIPYGFYAYADAQPYGNHSALDTNGNPIPDGVATGNVSLAINGVATLVPINSIGLAEYPLYTQAPGSYSFVASYAGDASFQPSTSPTQTLTIIKGATNLNLQAASTSIPASGSTTVTVLLETDSFGNYPTGTITMTGNGQTFVGSNIQTGALNDGAVAVLETFTVNGSQLASGANVLTVSYPGDTNYGSSSGTITITNSGGTVASPGFTVSGPTGGISISAPGQSGTGTVMLAPANGFTGAVSLTCAVAAGSTGVTCSIPATATITGTTAATATLTVSTTAGSAANTMPLRRFFTAGGEVALGCLLLLGVPARRRSWRSMVALLFVIVGLGAIGCGGSSGSGGGGGGGGTQAGTYSVTVSGTSGSVTANTTVTVTVQ